MSPAVNSDTFVPHNIARPIRGSSQGPLAGLTAAVKDMFAIRGEKSGGGNPDWLADQLPAQMNSVAVARLLDAGATIVGKTVCDEFFFSLAGINAHYGMPTNPRAPGRLPGGSSSGSAAAVAAGACDIALGSDTGGSVRVPASFCGLFGMRPSHSRVNMEGVMAMAPSFDTVGWFAAGPGLLRKTGHVLLEGPAATAPVVTVLLGEDCFAQADADVTRVIRDFLVGAAPLLPRPESTTVAAQGYDRWREAFRLVQGREIWRIYGEWIQQHQPSLGPGVRERIAFAATVSGAQAEAAREVMAEARAAIRQKLVPGTVLALPTTPCVAPRADAEASEMENFRTRTMTLTCIAGLSGLPQVTLPIGTVSGMPVGLSFVGWTAADEVLLDLAVSLAPCCGVRG